MYMYFVYSVYAIILKEHYEHSDPILNAAIYIANSLIFHIIYLSIYLV